MYGEQTGPRAGKHNTNCILNFIARLIKKTKLPASSTVFFLSTSSIFPFSVIPSKRQRLSAFIDNLFSIAIVALLIKKVTIGLSCR